MFYNFLVSTEIFGLSLFEIFEYFLVYGVIGWIFESCVVSAREKHWVNRGFLFGPFIPIYSFGVVSMVFLLAPLNALEPIRFTIDFLPQGSRDVFFDYKYFAIFVGGGLVCSLLEILVSWIMEKLFNMRWWDYTDYRFNFHGRACLSIGALWGLMSIIVISFLHPYLVALPLSYAPKRVVYVIMLVGYAILLADSILSAIMASKLSQKVKFLAKIKSEMEAWAEKSGSENKEELINKIKNSRVSVLMKDFGTKISEKGFNEYMTESALKIKEKYNEKMSKISNGESRFFKNMPDIKLSRDKNISDDLKEKALEHIERNKEKKEQQKEEKIRSKTSKNK